MVNNENYSLFIIHYLLGMFFHIIGGDILHKIFQEVLA